MELKHRYTADIMAKNILLIVPYGIETALAFSTCYNKPFLLIVPYGIETLQTVCSVI